MGCEETEDGVVYGFPAVQGEIKSLLRWATKPDTVHWKFPSSGTDQVHQSGERLHESIRTTMPPAAAHSATPAANAPGRSNCSMCTEALWQLPGYPTAFNCCNERASWHGTCHDLQDWQSGASICRGWAGTHTASSRAT